MPPFSRRTLIKLSLLAASPLVAPAIARGAPAPAAKTVLVIGAGISGLAAARMLHAAGHRVTVVEGRDRVGGRIWTNRNWKDVPVDLGASWIHGIDGNPVADLVRQLGIDTAVYDVERPASNPVYDANGHQLGSKELEWLTHLQDQANKVLGRTVRGAAPELNARDAMEQVLAGLAGTAAEKATVLELFSRELEDGLAADPQDIAAWGVNEGSGFQGHEVVFPQGYGQLVDKMAEGLDLRFNHKVTRIQHDASGARVFTSHGELAADIAIVTLPLGVLQEGGVTFSPALPENKRGAIDRLGMGVYNKAVFLFPEVFWGQAAIISQLHTDKGLWANWYPLNHYAQKPVLCALHGGSPARVLEAMSNQDILEDAMAHLRKIFGAAIPLPTDMHITRWQSDPFARGSYSFPKTGARPSDRHDLAAPVNATLLFAGEATHPDYSGTVHGALLSGWREARRVLGEPV
ncbi:MAG: flavin monoamine oxidase family protein [Pseudomonas sp.]|uniref:flavin monoamine oxidase family protein n=1 Tax=unclassified Pseudomonas TaxID=196821 RepID=UPI001CFBFEA8|nr:FAD-dependent oxidoreductase [Pseudomonas sp. L5B5]UCZ83863.1 FAD-dependent oxidoreductase [Pseudomonas sp. L5B5]